MNKPLMYLDSDLAISCLMKSLCSAGYIKQAEQLLGLTVSNPDSARHARRIVAGLSMPASTEKTRRGVLEMLSFASTPTMRTAVVQTPIDC
jgi:hypothetical protein